MIKPHGGTLVDRIPKEQTKIKLIEEAAEMPSLQINDDLNEDINNIGRGVFSPLKGFMTEEELNSVMQEMHLPNQIPWTIPIILDVQENFTKDLQSGDQIALIYNGSPSAILKIKDIYKPNKKVIAEQIFGTRDSDHPGVKQIYAKKNFLIGGDIELIGNPPEGFEEYTLYPKETRNIFQDRGWKTVVGFQTRNVPHLGHEYVQKAGLTVTDGLFVNPLIGKKKKGDFLDKIIIKSYEILLENYYNKKCVHMSILRTRMHYGGPKEAVHHAIMRKNFGCSHFIVGRDHAGVGDYYGPFDAHKIFDEFPEGELGIHPICFRSFYICKKCGGIVNDKICCHDGDPQYQQFISGSKMRKMIREKRLDNLNNFMRNEVAKFLVEQDELFIN
ncbi:MAG: sulfate adenylyltransferase [Candidatus Lokiarchaeota archaeon]|nr:sulfate adenylyltransferase [Candidatus Lokiarchaeota archaeon]